MMKARAVYLLLIALTIPLGLATRGMPELFPAIVARYGGDTLWALNLYWIFAFIQPWHTPASRFYLTLAVAFSIEFSQLYHAPWIDALRANYWISLLFGQGFLLSDLLCYMLGVSMALFFDLGIRRMPFFPWRRP